MRRATSDRIELCHLIVISIHALHEESDHLSAQYYPIFDEFQSTLSMRRATGLTVKTPSLLLFQSTLSMRRATIAFANRYVTRVISIHALHEESDERRL